MPQFKVTREEWKIAHEYLDDKPDGTKLPFSMMINVQNEVVVRNLFKNDPKPYRTFHSFIKKDGQIIALQRKHFVEGSSNKVKYAMDENGILYIAKIGDHVDELKDKEINILADLQLLKGRARRADKFKHYAFIQALGVSLQDLFSRDAQPKSLEARLDMAIQLTWKLYRLHAGHDSVTRTAYVHMDIKPDNITRTDDGQLHLIDFGLAEKYPNQPGMQKTGADRYVAYHDDNEEALTKEQYDVIAVKRVIHLPDSFYGGSKRFFSDMHEAMPSFFGYNLLSQQELEQFKLDEYISTFSYKDNKPDYSKDKTTGVMLCAMLINARYNLQIDNQDIAQDSVLMHAIVGFYSNEQLAHYPELSCNASIMKLMAALNLLNRDKQFDVLSSDAVLMEALERASTFAAVCVVVELRTRDMAAQYEAVLQCDELAEALFIVIKNVPFCDEQDLLAVINDQSKVIYKALLFLKHHCLEDNFKETLNNPALAHALANVASRECEVSVIRMLNMRRFTADEIIQVAQNSRLAEGTELVRANRFSTLDEYTLVVKLMVTKASTLDACFNMVHSELSAFQQLEILKDADKAYAFNILHAAGIESEEMLRNVAYNKRLVTIIIWLSEHNMESLLVRALEDHYFSSEVSDILSRCYSDEVTMEMLSNDKIRKCFNGIYNSKERFEGLKVLVKLQLIDQYPADTFASFEFYSYVGALDARGLHSFIGWMIEYPGSEYYLNQLFKEENASNPAYALCKILSVLPSDKRLEFINEVASVLDLNLLKNEMSNFNKIKALLAGADKQAFLERMFTPAELADKQILKNIKSTIKTTDWSYGYFDSQIHIHKDWTQITVPSSVAPQVHVLSNVSSGHATYSEAVAEIKQLGREQLRARETPLSFYKHSIFGKSETAKYFDQFETDESFEKAFVKKD